MAKQRRAWTADSAKSAKPSLSGTLKDEVEAKAGELITNILKPKYVQPPPEGSDFNYIIDITTKWIGSAFYFISVYSCPGTRAFAPTYEEKFARMDFVGEGNFKLSFRQHTGRWGDLFTSISVDDCMRAIQEDPRFQL